MSIGTYSSGSSSTHSARHDIVWLKPFADDGDRIPSAPSHHNHGNRDLETMIAIAGRMAELQAHLSGLERLRAQMAQSAPESVGTIIGAMNLCYDAMAALSNCHSADDVARVAAHFIEAVREASDGAQRGAQGAAILNHTEAMMSHLEGWVDFQRQFGDEFMRVAGNFFTADERERMQRDDDELMQAIEGETDPRRRRQLEQQLIQTRLQRIDTFEERGGSPEEAARLREMQAQAEAASAARYAREEQQQQQRMEQQRDQMVAARDSNITQRMQRFGISREVAEQQEARALEELTDLQAESQVRQQRLEAAQVSRAEARRQTNDEETRDIQTLGLEATATRILQQDAILSQPATPLADGLAQLTVTAPPANGTTLAALRATLREAGVQTEPPAPSQPATAVAANTPADTAPPASPLSGLRAALAEAGVTPANNQQPTAPTGLPSTGPQAAASQGPVPRGTA